MKYTPLRQESSEDEQDEVHTTMVHHLQDEQHSGDENSYEMTVLTGRTENGRRGRERKKQQPWLRARLIFIIAIILIIVVVIALELPYLTSFMPQPVRNLFYKTRDWTRTFNYSTDSCIRLFDVDEDGKLDVLFGSIDSDLMGKIPASRLQMKKFCKKLGEPFPCMGKITALRGYDGKTLWTLHVLSAPFEINCGNIDIDADGKMDCIAAGRTTVAVAFNPRNGSVLWTADNRVLRYPWNVYNPLILPDLNGDSVPEVVLCNGGDPHFQSTDLLRFAGRLILLSGATGRTLGRYLDVPESRESYISPVLHTTSDGSQYILFGNGGETIPGSFLAISVPDLYRYVLNLPRNATVNNTRGKYDSWQHGTRLEHGMIEIYRSTQKGVMVPLLLVDMNGDGVKDILMSAYDGVFELYDGETLQQLWKVSFPGYESYSTPAPAYFNEDKHLDFMVHLNYGHWPKFNYSLTVILNGATGKILWSSKSTHYQMTSDLVIKTAQKYRDAFLFRCQGVNHHEAVKTRVKRHESLAGRRKEEEEESSEDGQLSENNAEEGEDKDEDDDDADKLVKCDVPKEQYMTEFFLMDRSNVGSPIQILEIPPMEIHYKMRKDAQKKDSSLSDCALAVNEERTTSAIGDVDGDGLLDLVTITGSSARVVEGAEMNSFINFQTRIIKTNIADKLARNRRVQLSTLEISKDLTHTSHDTALNRVGFQPSNKQLWTEYMGRYSESTYYELGGSR